MNARYLTALFVATTFVTPNFAGAGEAIGTAKARGDYGNLQSQGSAPRAVAHSQRRYSYPAPRYSDPTTRDVPSTAVGQAPAEGRRYSQAPAAQSSNPCPESTSVSGQSSSGRRYSYAPAPQYSGNSVRRYSGNVGRSSQHVWAMPKTDPGKYSGR